MKIKSIKKVNSKSNLFDIQTISQNFFANRMLVHNSMIRPIPVPGSDCYEFRLGTKAGVTDVAMNAQVWMAQRPNYVEFVRSTLANGLTPIFEWCSRKNRIVVDYPEDRLVLTAIRHSETGYYLPYKALKAFAEGYRLDCVKVVESATSSVHELVDTIRAWESDEGAVIRFDSGHMLKIKADAYLTLHRSKDAISREKNVINVIVNDQVDDLIPILTESDAQRLRDFQRAFWMGVDDVASDVVDLYLVEGTGYEEQRDYARGFVASQPRHLHPFLYGLRKGKGMKDMLVDSIKKALSTQGKIDASRWMWGSLKWSV